MATAATDTTAQTNVRVDVATVVALALVAYAVGDVLHELVAHAGVCLAVGGRAVEFDTTHMSCDAVDGWSLRAVCAAGTLANLIAGFVALAIDKARGGRSLADYFLWLFAVHELFIGGGYLLSSPLGHFGDWNLFVSGLAHPWVWRVGLTGVGVALYRWTMKVGAQRLFRFLPSDPVERKARARALCWTPYVSGGLLLLMGGLLNQVGWQLVFVSAIAAGFFGPIGFVFMVEDVPKDGGGSSEWPRWVRGAWVNAVSVAVVIAFAVIARGVRLS